MVQADQFTPVSENPSFTCSTLVEVIDVVDVRIVLHSDPNLDVVPFHDDGQRSSHTGSGTMTGRWV